MGKKYIDKKKIKKDEDWLGNNAAFTCPRCGKVFIVSNFPPQNKGIRSCPECKDSVAQCTGKKDKEGTEAWIAWKED